jgi:hypothetical protein
MLQRTQGAYRQTAGTAKSGHFARLAKYCGMADNIYL